jgi:invasion protein IalB
LQARQSKPSKSDWRARCGKTACVAERSIYRKKSATPLLSVAVRVPRDSNATTLRLRLPLNVSIPSGASIQIGSAPAKPLALQVCEEKGCLAELAIADPEIAALTKGENLTVSVWNRENAKLDFQVPTSGFARAYAQIKKGGSQ